MKSKLRWLYVLFLEDDKYYVGLTTKEYPSQRIWQHFHGFGAGWTKLHKPIKTIDVINLGEVIEEEAKKSENVLVREYIKKYGLDNVRGGDISYPEPMIQRFGRIYKKEDWFGLTVVVLLMLAVVWLLLDKYNIL